MSLVVPVSLHCQLCLSLFTSFFPSLTDSDEAGSENSENDETYAPSKDDSDGSNNDSSNENSEVGSGDETHNYNTSSGDETDNVPQKSRGASSSSSDEGKFYEYSYRMFHLFRLAANSILWNSRSEYFNGIFIMFLAKFISHRIFI